MSTKRFLNQQLLAIIKKLDLRGNEARMTFRVFIWKLWGVETLAKNGVHQPKMVNPRLYGWGDDGYVQGLLSKSYHSRFLAVFRTPRSPSWESILEAFIPFWWLKILRFYLKTEPPFLTLNQGESI